MLKMLRHQGIIIEQMRGRPSCVPIRYKPNCDRGILADPVASEPASEAT
jgi:hypothetical protein